MKNYKHIVISLIAFIIMGTPWFIAQYPQSTKFVDGMFSYAGEYYNALILRNYITIKDLQDKYDSIKIKDEKTKINILIVPGHEPNFGGTEYGILKERDMVVEVSKYMQEFFQNNSHYDIQVTRDDKTWDPVFDEYFKNNWDSIISFVKESKSEKKRLVKNGVYEKITTGVIHNAASPNVALRLYGINKWNNEHKTDIAIHIHFNDYPRKNIKSPGKYSGFAIYIPEKQYGNSTTTEAIANTVFKRLSKYNPVSDLPKEEGGVIQEQELIAIGAENTLDAPSMLIEYGYIYEPAFSNPAMRQALFKDLAFQTYLGIQDFFGSGNDFTFVYDTLVLPYEWKSDFTKDNGDSQSILALQTALISDGSYPPKGKNINECPRTGIFGPCTLSALRTFQDKHGIQSETDFVGEKTRKVLNSIYSARIR
jgi:N-acetylmuramoyl-L-alanine amidase